jgi:hypothetical protein
MTSENASRRFYKPQWYDPYFFIPGSVPEKMVMKELIRRGIYFEHTPQTNPIDWGPLKQIASSDPTNWEPDFLFPQFKIWLEVQGAYFHTLPGIPEKEALRFALIEAAGWRPIYWWDYDIEARLNDIMDQVPEFYRPPYSVKGGGGYNPRDTGSAKQGSGTGHGVWGSKKSRWGTGRDHWGSHHNRPRGFGRTNLDLPFWEGGIGIDHLAGLRAANSARATTPQYQSKYRAANARRAKVRKKFRHR